MWRLQVGAGKICERYVALWLKGGWRAQWFSRKEGILIIWCLIWCGPEINSYWNEIFGVLLLGYPKKWFPTPGCALSKMLFDVCPAGAHWDPDPPPSAPQASTLYKLFESKVVLNVRGTWYFLRGTWYFAQNRMLVVMAGSGEAQKPYFWYPPFRPCEAGFVSILQTLRSISSQKHFSAKVKKTKVA